MRGLIVLLAWGGVLYIAAHTPHPWNWVLTISWMVVGVLVLVELSCGKGALFVVEVKHVKDEADACVAMPASSQKQASVRPIRRPRTVEEPIPAPWPFVPRRKEVERGAVDAARGK